MKVSEAYLTAINAAAEQTTFWAEFGFVPPGARENMTLSHLGFGKFGNLEQLNNHTYGMSEKWVSAEQNRFILDGTWQFIKDKEQRQTGEWSFELSDSDGWFSNPPYIEMLLDKVYDLIGVQIIFDDLGKEWATEVTVSYYNEAYTLIEEWILNNNQANMNINYPPNGVKIIRITINKWNLPRRLAKVCQVIPGQIRHFTDDNIYSFALKERISPFESLVIPEYKIIFFNENQEYNIINPIGAVSKLRELMEISSQIGLVTAAGIENVSTGDFFLHTWPDSSNDETASFICRPDLAFANKDFITSDLNDTSSVLKVAEAISEQARLKQKITVDPELQNIQVLSDMTHYLPFQNALGQLAVAAGGYVKFGRDGSYSIKSLTLTSPVRVLTYDNIYSKPQITQMTPLSGIMVNWGAWGSQNTKEFVEAYSPSGRTIEITSNFIGSQEEARRVGLLALIYFNKRLKYVIDYRGDMSIEAGDVISVETDYGFRNILVLEHETTYNINEFLHGRISGIEI